MSTLDERMALLDHYNDATPWQNAVHVLLTAIVERLEPAESRAEAAEPTCYDVADFRKENDPAAGEAAPEGDGWLAKCEMEWANAQRHDAFWITRKAREIMPRLIAAAKERDDLRAQVAALTKQRDERLEEVAALRLDLANVRAAIDRDW